MAFDYSKLRGKIVEKFGTQTEFSKAMNLSERTMSLKLNGGRAWKQDEICRAVGLLELQTKISRIIFLLLKFKTFNFIKT